MDLSESITDVHVDFHFFQNRRKASPGAGNPFQLAGFWADILDPVGEVSYLPGSVLGVHTMGGCRLMRKADTASSCDAGADRARYESTAAVGAYIVEHMVCTVLAVRAFIGADTGFGGSGWQVLVAHFTVRSEF